MNKIEIISAKNPRCRESEPGVITLDVRFSHLPSEVPFTACRNDCEEHGRELYSRAMFGEFGPIEVITPPPPTEAQQQDILADKLQQAARAMAPLEDAEKLEILTETEADQLAKWRRYRVKLYRLPQSKGWPIVKEWPESPENEQEV